MRRPHLRQALLVGRRNLGAIFIASVYMHKVVFSILNLNLSFITFNVIHHNAGRKTRPRVIGQWTGGQMDGIRGVEGSVTPFGVVEVCCLMQSMNSTINRKPMMNIMKHSSPYRQTRLLLVAFPPFLPKKRMKQQLAMTFSCTCGCGQRRGPKRDTDSQSDCRDLSHQLTW